jgi:hypothetical protein
MHIFIKAVPLFTLLAFSHSVAAKASSKENNRVDIKCFVELVGGGETISFWNITKDKVTNLPKSIQGRKVNVPNSKQKSEIYKAHECVLLKSSFTGSKAKSVDAKTAR